MLIRRRLKTSLFDANRASLRCSALELKSFQLQISDFGFSIVNRRFSATDYNRKILNLKCEI